MNFLITREVDINSLADKLFQLRLDHTETHSSISVRGSVQVFVTGPLRSAHDSDLAIRIFDGQCSHKGIFHHKFLKRDVALTDDLVESILVRGESPSNGIFCVAKVESGLNPHVLVSTDWLGQYPIYLWRSAGKYVISNNISMMQAVVPGVTKSLQPAVQNLVAAGSLGATHLNGIERIPFGTIITAGENLLIERRLDHQRQVESYELAIELAHGEIGAHIDAVYRSSDLKYIVDITGGADSRSILSFLGSKSKTYSVGGRSLTQYPSPDANVAGLLMEYFGIKIGRVPVCGVSIEKMVRQNAALSGGARDSGSAGSPLAITNLVQFRGCYGEIGGATPGIDYVSLAAKDGEYSHRRAVNLLLERRRMAGALDLVTSDAVEQTAISLVNMLEQLESEGHSREHLISEMYLRARCRTHFGLSSYIENNNKILPDPLGNRWLVEARRLLPARLHTNNQAIFDILLRNNKELAFMPMAGKKWDERIVPAGFHEKWSDMRIVDFNTELLSQIKGQLYEKASFADPDGAQFKPVTKALPMTYRPAHAQGGYIAPYQQLLRYFLENVGAEHEVWDSFNRDKVISYTKRTPEEFSTSGIDINAMGTVAAAISWKLDLEIPPRVSASQVFSLQD